MDTIENQITKCDERLSLLRSAWMDAKEDKKAMWLDLINGELETRLVLMAQRDSAKANPA